MENLQFRKAARQRAKIKIGLQGSSGSGKSYSSLLLAKGLVDDWSKIAVIDSEAGSSDLYCHLGGYNVVPISAPFTPEKYKHAIEICIQHGMEAIILDSVSHEWEYLLDVHSNIPGNSFQAWHKITPRHNEFINAILQAPVHVIATIRTKQDYIISEKNGKMVPEKVGLKGITRDGIDFELTIVFDVNTHHLAKASKDRTNLFVNKPEFQITEETGRQIRHWCELNSQGQNGEASTELMDDIFGESIVSKIASCSTLEELYTLFKENLDTQEQYKAQYIQQREKINHKLNFKSNGKLSIES